MDYQTLHDTIASAAGIRLRLRLQPLYGVGEIVFPCTVAGGKYQISKRRIPGYEESVLCAILDSVQSQANRMEAALLGDIRAGNIMIPHVVSDFGNIEGLAKPVGTITCFEAPHRIFDAIIRDSVEPETGKHFPHTSMGRAIVNSSSRDATAVFGVSPSSLLFGSWDSTGISGGLGEKYTRCVVSEIVGVNVEQAVRAGTRIDPLNAAGSIDPGAIMKESGDPMWSEIAKNRKSVKKPSELNHSSVPWEGGTDASPHGGVTADYIQQSSAISFAALRQLNFPVDGADENETSAAARTVLAAIALHASTLSVERGWHLRSRCDLVLEEGAGADWEILGTGGTSNERLSSEQSRTVLKEAVDVAKAAGLPWREKPIALQPSKALESLVVASQKAHRETASAE